MPGTGPLAAVVPGAFGGWMAMLRDYGTLPFAEVAKYAIHYAEHGYPVVPALTRAVRNVEQLLRDEWTTSAEVYLPVPEPGGLHRNPQLARTYRRLAESDDPLEEWYRGFVADAIVGFQQRQWMDSSGERHAGLLAEEDLRDWRATYEEPLAVDYQGLSVLKAGPWTQGPVFLQQLHLLEGFDLAAMGHESAEYIHTVTECTKLAFADREAWYGDPEFVDVPLDVLLSQEYAAERRAARRRARRWSCGPGAGRPRAASRADDGPVAPEAARDRGDTAARSDRPGQHGLRHAERRLAAILAGNPGARLPLGTRGQMFSLDAGQPNSSRRASGHGRRSRRRWPHRRRAVDGLRQSRRRLAGPVDAALPERVEFGMPLQEAVEAPTFWTSLSRRRSTRASRGRATLLSRSPPGRRPPPACGPGATRSRRRGRGRSGASAPPGASRATARGGREPAGNAGVRGRPLTLMNVWPGSRSRSARPGTARARTSRSSPRTPSASSCACSTTTARETRVELDASGRRSTGTATCPASGRASATATASTGRTPRRGPPLQPAQAR